MCHGHFPLLFIDNSNQMKIAFERGRLNGISWCVKCSVRSSKANSPSCLLATQMFLSLEDLKKIQECQPVTMMFVILPFCEMILSLNLESCAYFFPLYYHNEHRIQDLPCFRYQKDTLPPKYWHLCLLVGYSHLFSIEKALLQVI